MKNTNVDQLVNEILGEQNTETKKCEYDYFSQLVNDCIKLLRHKKPAFCFKDSQVKQIQSVIKCSVSYDGIYNLIPII